MGVYFGGPVTINDMQGPAPSGFHVPSKNELEGLLQAIENIFGYAGLNMVTYLKMPMAGYRHDPNDVEPSADVFSEGIQGFYSSSSASSGGCSYSLRIQEEDEVELANRTERSRGYSIRCFKDIPVTPDSGWTALYSNTIYHNSSLGLISIKSGNVWITIQDKNLGATTVYNNGDTLTDANCGYFYQWGNNYGFPHSGTVTTSTTRVDASSYGPGNYYNSSTFIIGTYDWSSVRNDNLRGGVSQGSTTKSVELKNAYIGECRVPGSNTIAYYKFDGNLNDSSGNNHTLSNYNNISYSSTPSAINLTVSNYLYFNNTDIFNHDWTFNAWVNLSSRNQYNEASTLMCQGTGSQNSMIFCSVDYLGRLFFGFYGNDHTGTIETALNQWINVCYTYNYLDKTYKAYINSVKDIEGINSTQYTIASGNLYVGALANVPSNLGYRVQGKLSEYILENKTRAEQEVTDYYNSIKGNYGL